MQPPDREISEVISNDKKNAVLPPLMEPSLQTHSQQPLQPQQYDNNNNNNKDKDKDKEANMLLICSDQNNSKKIFSNKIHSDFNKKSSSSSSSSSLIDLTNISDNSTTSNHDDGDSGNGNGKGNGNGNNNGNGNDNDNDNENGSGSMNSINNNNNTAQLQVERGRGEGGEYQNRTKTINHPDTTKSIDTSSSTLQSMFLSSSSSSSLSSRPMNRSGRTGREEIEVEMGAETGAGGENDMDNIDDIQDDGDGDNEEEALDEINTVQELDKSCVRRSVYEQRAETWDAFVKSYNIKHGLKNDFVSGFMKCSEFKVFPCGWWCESGNPLVRYYGTRRNKEMLHIYPYYMGIGLPIMAPSNLDTLEFRGKVSEVSLPQHQWPNGCTMADDPEHENCNSALAPAMVLKKAHVHGNTHRRALLSFLQDIYFNWSDALGPNLSNEDMRILEQQHFTDHIRGALQDIPIKYRVVATLLPRPYTYTQWCKNKSYVSKWITATMNGRVACGNNGAENMDNNDPIRSHRNDRLNMMPGGYMGLGHAGDWSGSGVPLSHPNDGWGPQEMFRGGGHKNIRQNYYVMTTGSNWNTRSHHSLGQLIEGGPMSRNGGVCHQHFVIAANEEKEKKLLKEYDQFLMKFLKKSSHKKVEWLRRYLLPAGMSSERVHREGKISNAHHGQSGNIHSQEYSDEDGRSREKEDNLLSTELSSKSDKKLQQSAGENVKQNQQETIKAANSSVPAMDEKEYIPLHLNEEVTMNELSSSDNIKNHGDMNISQNTAKRGVKRTLSEMEGSSPTEQGVTKRPRATADGSLPSPLNKATINMQEQMEKKNQTHIDVPQNWSSTEDHKSEVPGKQEVELLHSSTETPMHMHNYPNISENDRENAPAPPLRDSQHIEESLVDEDIILGNDNCPRLLAEIRSGEDAILDNSIDSHENRKITEAYTKSNENNGNSSNVSTNPRLYKNNKPTDAYKQRIKPSPTQKLNTDYTDIDSGSDKKQDKNKKDQRLQSKRKRRYHISTSESHKLFAENKTKDWKGYMITYFIPMYGGMKRYSVNGGISRGHRDMYGGKFWYPTERGSSIPLLQIFKQAEQNLPKCIEATVVWYDTCDFSDEGICEEKVHGLLQEVKNTIESNGNNLEELSRMRQEIEVMESNINQRTWCKAMEGMLQKIGERYHYKDDPSWVEWIRECRDEDTSEGSNEEIFYENNTHPSKSNTNSRNDHSSNNNSTHNRLHLQEKNQVKRNIGKNDKNELREKGQNRIGAMVHDEDEEEHEEVEEDDEEEEDEDEENMDTCASDHIHPKSTPRSGSMYPSRVVEEDEEEEEDAHTNLMGSSSRLLTSVMGVPSSTTDDCDVQKMLENEAYVQQQMELMKLYGKPQQSHNELVVMAPPPLVTTNPSVLSSQPLTQQQKDSDSTTNPGRISNPGTT